MTEQQPDCPTAVLDEFCAIPPLNRVYKKILDSPKKHQRYHKPLRIVRAYDISGILCSFAFAPVLYTGHMAKLSADPHGAEPPRMLSVSFLVSSFSFMQRSFFTHP